MIEEFELYQRYFIARGTVIIPGKTHAGTLWKLARAQALQFTGFLLDTLRCRLDHGALQAGDFFKLRVNA